MARRAAIIAGLLLFSVNLWGSLCPGVDIAMRGISSAQPLFLPGLPLRVLPLLAFMSGVIAGSGLLAQTWWARGMIVAYAVMLALSAPMWAQQVSLGFYRYTSKPPALLSVLIMCFGAVVLALAAVIFANRPAVKALFLQPIPSEHRSCLWSLAVAAVVIANLYFAMIMKVIIPYQVHICSKDYASAQQRVEAMRKYSSLAPVKKVTDAAYDLRSSHASFAPDCYVYRLALRGMPGEVAAWAKRNERTGWQRQLGDSEEFLASLGANWQIQSAPVDYRLGKGYARVYEQEGIILIAVSD